MCAKRISRKAHRESRHDKRNYPRWRCDLALRGVKSTSLERTPESSSMSNAREEPSLKDMRMRNGNEESKGPGRATWRFCSNMCVNFCTRINS